MSDETELSRLYADIKVLERYSKYGNSAVVKDIRDKIAALEAVVNPWREGEAWIANWKANKLYLAATAYTDHLVAEVDRLTKRVAELEAEPFLAPDRVLATASVVAVHQYNRILAKECCLAVEALNPGGWQNVTAYKMKGVNDELA